MVWEALKAAIEIGDDDLETARAIIQCAGISLPRGLLTECYDDRGFRYNIPLYCLSDPVNLHDQLQSPKAIIEPSSQQQPYRVRLWDGRDLRIEEGNARTVLDLKNEICKQIKNPDPSNLRVLWQGQGPLKDQQALDDLGIPHNVFIQVWQKSV